MSVGTAVSASRPATAVRPADERFMRLALALGARHLGLTWPNPSVGAVVVDEGSPEAPRIVGQGITQVGGRPHAERVALAEAGAAARGATLYVSLEPCSHHGKTPPCTEAVIASGIRRVVAALGDPDPRVSGRGFTQLRAAGVEVVEGVLADEARRAHRGHIARVTQGRPSVTLKLARTPDGYAGRRAGPRLLVTGEAANARVHLLRAHADAVLIGLGTLIADDPLLTVRLPGLEQRSPVRVVLDSRLRTPPTARVVVGAAAVPTWIVAGEGASAEAEVALCAAGAEVLRVPAGPDGRVPAAAALRVLAERGITRVLCEGGPVLAEALTQADLIDEVVLATGAAPLGEKGVPAVGPALAAALADRFRLVADERAGPDRIETFERA